MEAWRLVRPFPCSLAGILIDVCWGLADGSIHDSEVMLRCTAFALRFCIHTELFPHWRAETWHCDWRLLIEVNHNPAAFAPCQLLWLLAAKLQRSCYISRDLFQSLYLSQIPSFCTCCQAIPALPWKQCTTRRVCVFYLCLWMWPCMHSTCVVCFRMCVCSYVPLVHTHMHMCSINFELVYNNSVTQRPIPHHSLIMLSWQNHARERERDSTWRWGPVKESERDNFSPSGNLWHCIEKFTCTTIIHHY